MNGERICILGRPQDNLRLQLLPGISIEIRPIDYFEMLVFEETAQRHIDDLRRGIDAVRAAGVVLQENFDVDKQTHVNALYREILTKEIAAEKIVSWTGFRDKDGNDLPVSKETARRVMDIYVVAKAFFEKVTEAHVALAFAKKESGIASNGSPGAVPNTAEIASFTTPTAAEASAA